MVASSVGLQHKTDCSALLLREGVTKITNQQLSEGNFMEKEKLVAGPRWAPDTKGGWPTDCRS
jgi:hypothetical protein